MSKTKSLIGDKGIIFENMVKIDKTNILKLSFFQLLIVTLHYE